MNLLARTLGLFTAALLMPTSGPAVTTVTADTKITPGPAGTTATTTTSAMTANPYGKIVVRNLFGLKDPPPPPDPESIKPPAPPISLQGFTTILGKNQVLFKVTLPAKPPQPGSEVSKIMTEGERDGEITVLEINLADRSVKFDNYGTVEVKNMKDHAAKPGGAPMVVAGAVPQPNAGGIITPAPAYAPQPAAGGALAGLPAASTATAGASIRASGSQSTTRQTRYGPSTTTPATGIAAQGAKPAPGQNWPPENHLSGEDQDLFIEALRQAGQNSDMLPPTKLNPTANLAPPSTPKTTKPQ